MQNNILHKVGSLIIFLPEQNIENTLNIISCKILFLPEKNNIIIYVIKYTHMLEKLKYCHYISYRGESHSFLSSSMSSVCGDN